MPINTSERLVVAGAGLAGTLLALSLARRGFGVDVYERRRDPRAADAPSGRSINLALSARGMHALDRVGLLDEVLQNTIPMRGRILHARTGSLDVLPYGQRNDEVIRSVSRSALNTMLLDALVAQPDSRVYFDHGITDYDPSSGHLSIETSDGSIVERAAPVVFAADGAGSPIRRALERTADFNVTQDRLSHGYKELTIPPLNDGTFRIDPHALHIWPRGTYMLIALPNLDGTFTCTLFLPHDADPGFNQLTSPYLVSRFFQDEFPDAVPHLGNLVDDYMTNPTGHLGTIRCEKWHVDGRVVLLGDAAHAIVPFFGQGMNCAFEDVSVLDTLLDEAPDSWSAVFGRFESLRRDNANAIADMALENYIEMRDKVADPSFQLRRDIALKLEKRHPERFIPRYSLVSFHRIPYTECVRLGVIQGEILDAVCLDIDTTDAVDWTAADQMVTDRLEPLL